MFIYFAGSIRGGREDKELYLQIINLLSNYGSVLTEHIGDAELTSMGDKGVTENYIYERDMGWLAKADIIVAEITTPSLGVGYEIGRAESMKKPILCLYREVEGRKHSAMILGNNNLSIGIYKDITEVSNILKEFFDSF